MAAVPTGLPSGPQPSPDTPTPCCEVPTCSGPKTGKCQRGLRLEPGDGPLPQARGNSSRGLGRRQGPEAAEPHGPSLRRTGLRRKSPADAACHCGRCPSPCALQMRWQTFSAPKLTLRLTGLGRRVRKTFSEHAFFSGWCSICKGSITVPGPQAAGWSELGRRSWAPTFIPFSPEFSPHRTGGGVRADWRSEAVITRSPSSGCSCQLGLVTVGQAPAPGPHPLSCLSPLGVGTKQVTCE